MDSTASCFIAYVAIALAFFQAPSSIEGFVRLGNTNEPLRGAAVTLERLGIVGGGPNLGSGISIDSDANGRFVFKDVAPGNYRLRVAKNGYVTSYYGAVSFFDTGTVLQLVPGQAKKDIVLQLTLSGTLNGVVSDLDDNPIPNTTVQVLRTAFTEFGEPTLQSVGVARTDDRGSFRIYSLPPGSYYVLVGGQPSESGSRLIPVQSGDVPWTFYPNGQDWRFANLVAVASGTESTVRMRVRRQTLVSVAGRLLDSSTQEIVRNARLSLARQGIPFRGLGGNIVTQNEAGFRFVNVEPGEYRLTAFLGSGPGSSPIFSGNVTVNDENLESLVFTATEPVSVKGHLRIEGVGKPMDLGIQLVPSANGVIGTEAPRPYIAHIDKEGRFTVESVLPGDYRVRVLTFDAGYYAKSINAGGSDVITKTLHVENAGPDLEVVLSSRVAQINGVVQDQQQQPVAGAMIVLIPQVGRDRFDLYRQVSANADGRFAFSSVAPGRYTMFALSGLERDSYFDPAFVESLAGQGTLVRAGESTTATVALTLISRISR